MMDKLLSEVLDAHGGLQNWAKVTEITTHMSLGGPFWAARGWPGIYTNQTVTVDPHRERVSIFAIHRARPQVDLRSRPGARGYLVDGWQHSRGTNSSPQIVSDSFQRRGHGMGCAPSGVFHKRCGLELHDRSLRFA